MSDTDALALFESVSLYVGIGGLVLYMLYIMYKLAVESGAGRYGMIVIFFSLGLGIVGFVAKSVIQVMLTV